MSLFSFGEQMDIMIDYLFLKVQEKDWHAVADAAMDIREMEARETAFDQAQHRSDLRDLKTVKHQGGSGDR